MKRIVRDSLVVVFVLLGIGAAVLGYFWFSGRLETGLRRDVFVHFRDVTGLRVGDPVEVLGIPKGKVASIDLVGRRVRCRLAIDRDVELTRDARFAIRSVSYLGSDRYLMVTMGDGPAADDSLVFAGHNEALDLEETFLRLDAMLVKFNPEKLSEELRKAGEDLMAIVRDQLARFNTELGRFNSNFDITVAEIQEFSATFDSLAAMLDKESTAGKLFSSKELYDEVRETNKQVQELITDIKTNPRRYFKISIF